MKRISALVFCFVLASSGTVYAGVLHKKPPAKHEIVTVGGGATGSSTAKEALEKIAPKAEEKPYTPPEIPPQHQIDFFRGLADFNAAQIQVLTAQSDQEKKQQTWQGFINILNADCGDKATATREQSGKLTCVAKPAPPVAEVKK